MFTVPGDAAPQGSKRAFKTRGGRIALVESSSKVKPYRASVAAAAVAAGVKLIDGPVSVFAVFTFVRPRSHFTGKGALRASAPAAPGKPDLDKLARAVGDALTGLAYRDDAQIMQWHLQKRYGDRAETAIFIHPA
jgi:Holliday junction resolvase RusA-like endonuclease